MSRVASCCGQECPRASAPFHQTRASKVNWLLLKNSLLVGVCTTLLAVRFGLIAALWLAGLPRVWRNWFFGVSLSALGLPPFRVTNCWLPFLGHTGVWRNAVPLGLF